MARIFTLTLDGLSIKFGTLTFVEVEYFTAEAKQLSRDRKKALELNKDAEIDVEPFKKHMLEICLAGLKAADSNGEWSIEKVKEIDKGLLEALYARIQEKSRMVPLKDGETPDLGEVKAERPEIVSEEISPTREA